MAQAKKAAKSAKAAAKAAGATHQIDWTQAGSAEATLFLADQSVFTAIQVSLTPGFNNKKRKSAFIGDTTTGKADILDVEDFEPDFLQTPSGGRFVKATFANLAKEARTFDLVFWFGDAKTAQYVNYTVPGSSLLTDYIDVTLV